MPDHPQGRFMKRFGLSESPQGVHACNDESLAETTKSCLEGLEAQGVTGGEEDNR